jgi:hypothetical protein
LRIRGRGLMEYRVASVYSAVAQTLNM